MIFLICNLIPAIAANAQTASNYAIIQVNPSNSTVFVDSNEFPSKDGIASCLLSEGKHSYKITCPDFETAEGYFTVNADRRTEITVTLRSVKAHLTLTSEMDDVTLYIDGNIIAGTKWSGYVDSGKHTVKAEKNGYQPYVSTFAIENGDSKEIKIPNLQKETGGVNVNILPFDAEVYIDDKMAGLSPLVINNLDAGKHSLLIKKENHHPLETAFYIQENKLTNIEGTLKPYESVDLGLSVEWASCNLGATEPEETGDLYCWGAPAPSWDYSPACKTNSFGLTNLMAEESVWTSSYTYDAAKKNWGECWRMPTHREIQELISKCRWIKTRINGVEALKVIGPNGNYIILPYGDYWAGDRNKNWNISDMRAYSLRIYDVNGDDYIQVSCGDSWLKVYEDASKNYRSTGYDNSNFERAMWKKLMIRPVLVIRPLK